MDGPHDYAASLELIRIRVSADPDFLRAADQYRRLKGTTQTRLPALSPRTIRGEQLMNSLLPHHPEFRFAPYDDRARLFLDQAGDLGSRYIFSEGTYRAVPYLWRRDLVLLAKSMPLPRHVLAEDLFPHDTMYWSLDSELQIELASPYRDGTVQAWLIVRTRSAYLFAAFVEQTNPSGIRGEVLSVQFVPMGARYPDDFAGGWAEDMLKLAAFLNSPFVNVERHRPVPITKKARRRYGPRIGDPVSLNVVTLRAEVREAVRVEAGDGPRWKQRWLVRGHYRAQWYPSTRSHKVIWVAPYVKGPEDAPFKQPVYAVNR